MEVLSSNSPLLIVNNEKQDHRRDIDERQLRGRFTNFKEMLSVNLATGRGLFEVLECIKYHIAKLPHVGAPLPKTWVRVREALEKDERNYINVEEYLDICQKHGFSKLEDKLQLSGYLHDLGVCLHFQEDALLKRRIILKPKWGTDAAYRVLDNDGVKNNFGQFTRSDLNRIGYEPVYADMQDELLQLMINFQLCYEVSDNPNSFIAPQLLGINQPDYNWDISNNIILRYTYDGFMPKGIIARFIVAMHRWIKGNSVVWKSGVVLQNESTWAEVIEDYERREMRIRIAGQGKRDMLTIISYELDKIHDFFRLLPYTKWIPCNCPLCQGSQEPYFYRFDVLRRFKADGQDIQCQRSYRMVHAEGLIDDVINPAMVPQEGRDRSVSDIEPDVTKREIFISYAWGGQSEEIVRLLDKAFQDRGVTIVGDKDSRWTFPISGYSTKCLFPRICLAALWDSIEPTLRLFFSLNHEILKAISLTNAR